MLPANMFGEMTSICCPPDALALQPQQRQRRLPLGVAVLAIRHVDAGVAVVVALDEPLEAEVDQRRRFDQEFAGGDSECICAGNRRLAGYGEAEGKAAGKKGGRGRAGACEHAGLWLKIAARGAVRDAELEVGANLAATSRLSMERIQTTRGITVSYDRYGSGPLLVLVHGSFSNHETNWTFVKPLLQTSFTMCAVARGVAADTPPRTRGTAWTTDRRRRRRGGIAG